MSQRLKDLSYRAPARPEVGVGDKVRIPSWTSVHRSPIPDGIEKWKSQTPGWNENNLRWTSISLIFYVE
eukprot:scaffold140_cov210-Skeletonema_marinoi.AAC.3